MNYKKVLFGTIAYFLSSFVIQGMLGFALAGDYVSSIPIMRNPPIFPLALSQAVITGIAFSALYPLTKFQGTPIVRGLKYGLLIGVIIVPFIAMDLPARFMIPSAGMWIGFQGLLGMLHHAIAGSLVGLIYGQDG